MNYGLIAQRIKEAVPMADAARLYTGTPPIHNRFPCVFHGGKDRNMLCSDWGFKCFVCGAHGDVIGFAQRFFSIGFKEACEQLDRDFNLGLFNQAESDQDQSEYARRMAEISKQKQKKKLEDDMYSKALDRYTRLDRITRECEPFSDEWCDAMKHIDQARYELISIQKVGGQNNIH